MQKEKTLDHFGGDYTEAFKTTEVPPLPRSPREMAQHLISIGINPVPTKGKIPTRQGWQSTQMTPTEAARWNGSNVGAVCGAISGNLECLDFDAQGEGYSPWAEKIHRLLPSTLKRLVIERTPSGGYHVWYKCPQAKIPGNSKLASKSVQVDGPGAHEYRGKQLKSREKDGKWYITPELIETRGSGGQAICFPSNGYELIQPLDRWEPPEITPNEQALLIAAAKAIDQTWAEIAAQPASKTSANRPGDDYNELADAGRILPILERHGFKKHATTPIATYLTRPGKEEGISAALYDSGVLHVFSSNVPPFEMDQSYAPFAVYAHLEHGGDFAAAARELSRQGFGDDPQDHRLAQEGTPGTDAAERLAIMADNAPEYNPADDIILPFQFIHVADLIDNLKPIEWVIDGIMPDHALYYLFFLSTDQVNIAFADKNLPVRGAPDGAVQQVGALLIF